MRFVYDDGGRAAAGYKGSTGDCTCRAIAIATGLPYLRVYYDLTTLGRQERHSKRRRGQSHPRTGVYALTEKRYLEGLGWVWQPTMFIGSGCQVHLRDGELPMGRLLVTLSKHLVAVIDGVVHDTGDPTRNGTRCVYGYYWRP